MNIRKQIQTKCTTAILNSNFIGIINVSPRLGKTKCVIDALNQKQLRPDIILNILIMAPKIPILKSWEEEIKKWNLRKDVRITYIWSNSLKKLKAETSNFNLIIADECHDYNESVMSELRSHLYKNGTRILALTGTLTPEVKYDMKVQLQLDVIYEYSFIDAIKDGIVADYEITCIACNLDNVDKYVEAGSKEKPFFQTEFDAYNYWNSRYDEAVRLRQFNNLKFLMSKRMNILYTSKTKLLKTQNLIKDLDRCLIFTGRQEIAEQIGEGSYHSKSNANNLQKFINQDINKLSVISMISMGITVPKLKNAVFNQLKSVETLAIQQSMRAMNIEGNEKAQIWVVYLKNTQDEVWVKKALDGFEQHKIKWL